MAVLLWSASVIPSPADQAGRELVAQVTPPEGAAQIGSEAAQDAGAHHVDAPEQEGHLAQQLDDGARHRQI